jgi:mannosyl-oligosaccharide glucosidase
MNAIWWILSIPFAIGSGMEAAAVDSSRYNETMFWGTYRPNVYFGTRSRSATTFLTGLLWHDLRNLESRPWESMNNLVRHSVYVRTRRWNRLSLETA